jgi:hypothetical protein
VKTSEKPLIAAVAYISRHEWDVACESTNHRFHFWHIYSDQKKLAVLEVAELQQHIPLDEGEGTWQNAKIPFQLFIKNFQLYNDLCGLT